MNVTKEMTGDLTAVLKIDVTAADYAESVSFICSSVASSGIGK